MDDGAARASTATLLARYSFFTGLGAALSTLMGVGPVSAIVAWVVTNIGAYSFASMQFREKHTPPHEGYRGPTTRTPPPLPSALRR